VSGIETAAGARAPQRTLRIGVTGPIGCGKSAIAGALAARGGVVIDADRLARDATPPGSAALAAIERRFGDTVIRADGALDRAAMARIAFSDPVTLRDLEAIVHPAVRPLLERAVEDAESARAPFVLVEAIKLIEAGYAANCDEVWLVTCTPEQQRERLAGRGLPADEVERRMAIQGGDLIERLRPAATRVIDASGSREATGRNALAALDAALQAHGRA
jgi:dephospho-CoA kinase